MSKQPEEQLVSSEELYEQLIHKLTIIYGISKLHLDRKIDSYVKKGLSREEAIRRVSKEISVKPKGRRLTITSVICGLVSLLLGIVAILSFHWYWDPFSFNYYLIISGYAVGLIAVVCGTIAVIKKDLFGIAGTIFGIIGVSLTLWVGVVICSCSIANFFSLPCIVYPWSLPYILGLYCYFLHLKMRKKHLALVIVIALNLLIAWVSIPWYLLPYNIAYTLHRIGLYNYEIWLMLETYGIPLSYPFWLSWSVGAGILEIDSVVLYFGNIPLIGITYSIFSPPPSMVLGFVSFLSLGDVGAGLLGYTTPTILRKILNKIKQHKKKSD
ncbi:MAG: hypothetical protein H3Z51_12405 [archaeon]|nr:hypothetical protein [archaeon]